MKISVLVLFAVTASAVLAVPVKKLSQAEVRASLITKDNIAEYLAKQRQAKRIAGNQPLVPKPFTVTTSLNVRDSASGSRKSRTFFDEDGTPVVEGVRMPDDESDRVTWRNGRVINNIFVPNGAPVPPEAVAASLPQRNRQPKSFNYDDFYRNRPGVRHRLNDNMAVESRSDQVFVEPPAGFGQSQTPKEARDYKYHAGNTNSGRPVYYIVEEPDSLHSDRSPYDFEPADTHTSLNLNIDRVSDYTQSGLKEANSGDFVIKEHTYTMCPGCPTFSIPVPIPKSKAGTGSKTDLAASAGSLDGSGIEYQHARNRTFLEKVGDRVIANLEFVQNSVLKAFDPIKDLLGLEEEEGNDVLDNSIDNKNSNPHDFWEKSDQPPAAAPAKRKLPFQIMPVAIAAVATMAAGAYGFLNAQRQTVDARSLSETSRSFEAMLDSAKAKYEWNPKKP